MSISLFTMTMYLDLDGHINRHGKRIWCSMLRKAHLTEYYFSAHASGAQRCFFSQNQCTFSVLFLFLFNLCFALTSILHIHLFSTICTKRPETHPIVKSAKIPLNEDIPSCTAPLGFLHDTDGRVFL